MGTIFQATLPTGVGSLIAGKVLPGIGFLYGRDVVPNFLSAAGNSLANRAVDEAGQPYFEFAQSFTTAATNSPSG
ncbi:MAG TPA: hypothetical protein VKD71_02810 [Gemmataceae bacterium]|nr:hypothetical protein [Gemmataceae bacterium]